MHPEIFSIGGFTVYSYGLMVAVGFAVAVFFIYRCAGSFGFDRNRVIDAMIIALLAGIAGARALYVLVNLPHYLQKPIEVLNLSRGGLIWYGGFVAALVAMALYARLSRWNIWDLLDLMVPYVALAQAFGRIGCFLNGCCYGLSAAPGAVLCVTYPGEIAARYPSQLYAAGALFCIFLILRAWQSRRRFPGEIFFGYCMLYGGKRFLIEFLRGDNPKVWLGLTMSQGISLVVGAAAAALFIRKAAVSRRQHPGLEAGDVGRDVASKERKPGL